MQAAQMSNMMVVCAIRCQKEILGGKELTF